METWWRPVLSPGLASKIGLRASQKSGGSSAAKKMLREDVPVGASCQLEKGCYNV